MASQYGWTPDVVDRLSLPEAKMLIHAMETRLGILREDSAEAAD